MELVVVICLGFGWAKSYLCIYSNIFQGKLKSFPLGRDRFLQPKKWWKYSAFEAIVKNVLMCLSWKFLWVAKWNDHFLPGKKKKCVFHVGRDLRIEHVWKLCKTFLNFHHWHENIGFFFFKVCVSATNVRVFVDRKCLNGTPKINHNSFQDKICIRTCGLLIKFLSWSTSNPVSFPFLQWDRREPSIERRSSVE